MQRMIDCATWDDPWFAELEPDAKLLFLYLLTNRRSTAAGAFEITVRAMAFETGLTVGRIDELLPQFGDRVVWWSQHQVIWVRNFFKRQAANEKFTISARRVVTGLPIEIQQTIGSAYPNLISEEVSALLEAHGNGYPMGMGTPSLVIDREEDRDREEVPIGTRLAPVVDDPEPPEPVNQPEPPKPRTARQQASDAKHERRVELYAAWCRGIGLDPESEEAEVGRKVAYNQLKPITDTETPTPEDFEACTRFLGTEDWRPTPPTISDVMRKYGPWAAAGRPERAQPRSRAGSARASPAGGNIESREDAERRLQAMRKREAATT